MPLIGNRLSIDGRIFSAATLETRQIVSHSIEREKKVPCHAGIFRRPRSLAYVSINAPRLCTDPVADGNGWPALNSRTQRDTNGRRAKALPRKIEETRPSSRSARSKNTKEKRSLIWRAGWPLGLRRGYSFWQDPPVRSRGVRRGAGCGFLRWVVPHVKNL